ncbi:adenosylcobinamide-GDP ribazoletransferase [Nitratireductor pacificus]|uniref:Adenosylcobinamide-GDP ribazoletransferase n=1 Tax=Nitratireductor pacificus pht-3B TaxID=391937 RepID=K2MPT1_9HYPH|nr:adenosylcobinamide-GDP ribazoletransferase [Nitratireductor pacificus]EKF19347.1 cobalamin (5'-phosphate) synthase [Nitratireductor pacificus pht-3B]
MSEPRPALSPLRDIAACIGFYTRLPLPAFAMPARGFAEAQWAAPVAGLLVGFIGGAAMLAALALSLPATVAAALTLAATLLVTGALHEDGLADVADGFGGGTTRERKLAIMKDSRIGAYGVAALGLSLLLRWSALATLGWAAFPALLAAHATSRALMPALMRLLPPARADGVSAGAGRPGGMAVVTALLIGGFVLLAAGPGLFLVAAPLLAIALFLVRRLAARQIGGQTGDVLGALQQGAEALVLVAATLHLT